METGYKPPCKSSRKSPQVARYSQVRQWRETEADCLAQMMELLPFPAHIKAKLSRTDILRLSTNFLQVKQLEAEFNGCVHSMGEANLIVDILDGFLLTMDQTGLILYVSQDVKKILGHDTHELMGMNLAEFLHPGDQEYFYNRIKSEQDLQETGLTQAHVCKKEFVVRLRYRISNDKKKVRQTGFVGMQMRGSIKTAYTGGRRTALLTVACYPLCLAPSMELSFFELTTVIRFDKNDRVTYVDERASEFLGHDMNVFLGAAHSHAWHPADARHHFKDFWNFFNQRGSMVATYKAVTRDGRMFEGVSRDTIIFGSKGEKLFSVCVEFIIRSGRVRIKKWPIQRNIMFLGDSYGLPGEGLVSIKSSLDEVVDRNPLDNPPGEAMELSEVSSPDQSDCPSSPDEQSSIFGSETPEACTSSSSSSFHVKSTTRDVADNIGYANRYKSHSRSKKIPITPVEKESVNEFDFQETCVENPVNARVAETQHLGNDGHQSSQANVHTVQGTNTDVNDVTSFLDVILEGLPDSLVENSTDVEDPSGDRNRQFLPLGHLSHEKVLEVNYNSTQVSVPEVASHVNLVELTEQLDLTELPDLNNIGDLDVDMGDQTTTGTAVDILTDALMQSDIDMFPEELFPVHSLENSDNLDVPMAGGVINIGNYASDSNSVNIADNTLFRPSSQKPHSEEANGSCAQIVGANSCVTLTPSEKIVKSDLSHLKQDQNDHPWSSEHSFNSTIEDLVALIDSDQNMNPPTTADITLKELMHEDHGTPFSLDDLLS